MSAIKKPFFTGRSIVTQGGREVKRYFTKIPCFLQKNRLFFYCGMRYNVTIYRKDDAL